MAERTGAATRARLHHGLRIATLLVATAIVGGLGLTNLLRNLDRYESATAQLVAIAALAAVLATDAVLVVLRRPWWSRARLPAVAVVLAASALSYATLPEGRTSTTVDWAFGAANWVGLVVLLDRPLRSLLAFLAAHELTALLHLLSLEEPTRAALLRFATGSVNVIGYPLCVAVVTVALRRIGTAAARAQREIEQVRTAEAVAVESHRRRRQRFAELSGSTVPLLEGLADGSLSPADTGVRRRCAIEAARMRRLFAEIDTVADPLLHELRHCADIADRRGVLVDFDARGRCPPLPVPVRRDLTEAALAALATAGSWARVTVVGEPALVSVSVVADCGGIAPPEPASDGIRVETFRDDDLTWMEVTWQQPTGSRTGRSPR
ncbi:hypothetical protein B0I33_106290 [Prauserella shujinwangii]|uniref:Signal transduction histidine kinase n=1 Tax=Prauserella shujinwangii TaxID=1453103 RepID=A0A2T0LTX6_9PSEU|nr:hypothetical protein [Prauserella shujinwangii]PRX47189.1 hypothetical protein B0I33_106290 [Prauserella shujinwangii]